MVDVTVVNRQRTLPARAREIARFVRRLAAAKPPGSTDRMGVCLVSDRAMRDYNRRHRGKNATTDVLAFPGDGTTDAEGGRHLGDIVISVPRAVAQAREAGHPPAREIEILLLHGYLHLLGYDHERDRGRMRRLERTLAARLFAPWGGRSR